jgi:hypothetical protein
MTVNEWAAGGMSQDGFFNLSGWIVYDPYLELWAVLCFGSGRCFFRVAKITQTPEMKFLPDVPPAKSHAGQRYSHKPLPGLLLEAMCHSGL